MEQNQMVPVTILTGFLGSGKTTLLNRILKEQHGHRIAVIENEFGEAGIDNELLVQDAGEQIVEMNNGCICCTVRGDLVRILGELQAKREAKELDFERIIIETTGMADPGPVAQTFFMDEDIGDYYLLDSIVTLVDAKHARKAAGRFPRGAGAGGFRRPHPAVQDRSDQCRGAGAAAHAPGQDQPARADQAGAFRRNAAGGHTRHPRLQPERDTGDRARLPARRRSTSTTTRCTPSCSARTRLSTAVKLEEFLSGMIQVYGPDLLRYKGVLWLDQNANRVVFQGVHMLMGGDVGKPWGPEEKRGSVMVFIGRKLPEDLFVQGLKQCLVG